MANESVVSVLISGRSQRRNASTASAETEVYYLHLFERFENEQGDRVVVLEEGCLAQVQCKNQRVTLGEHLRANDRRQIYCCKAVL
jgi:hypothetical protein